MGLLIAMMRERSQDHQQRRQQQGARGSSSPLALLLQQEGHHHHQGVQRKEGDPSCVRLMMGMEMTSQRQREGRSRRLFCMQDSRRVDELMRVDYLTCCPMVLVRVAATKNDNKVDQLPN